MATIDKKGVLHGSVYNIVYRGYFDKQVAQMKPKKFKQTLASKESSLEFGLCSTTARVIRHAFGYTYGGYDGRMINRMNSAVRNGVTASQKARGERDMHDADLGFLNGFQFNNNSPLPKVLRARPQTCLDAENKICIELPAITRKDIQAPSVNVHNYVLRFVAIAFDFKKEVFCYNSVKEIKIGYKESFEGGVIRLDDEVIKGRLVMLSMSIHAYASDGFGGAQTFNSKAWSPSELIGAWHIEAETETETENSDNGKTYRIIPLYYPGNNILKEIASLREKAEATAKKRPDKTLWLKPKSKVKTDTGGGPPKGDIKFPEK
ncbi:hypothetical protein [Desertivirga xinjiangensis]|uniref:hypothetical protein n=1 Tax=Desertivirga xinjiangensis TaxID=539206 RepID=UPI00210AC1A4|nr:hypothetical protein [Pedobacter xinjiangensis]